MEGNLFAQLPLNLLAGERIDPLLVEKGLRLERIVSQGQASPPGFWYDQVEAEWVVLLSGAAGLRFEDEDEVRVLKPGDWLLISPRRRHRVEWTDAAGPTIWLALHFPSAD